jgi:hypothetical protein
LCRRVNAVRRPTIRDAFHRSGAFALRRPFGRPAGASFEPRGFATPRPTIDAFGAGEPCGTPALDPRSRTSLPARSRFSGSRRRPSTSATVYDARAHPASPLEPRAREALARRPWPAPTDAGCVGHPAALPQRGAREPRPARNGLRRCVPLGVEHGSRVEVCERKSSARSDDVARCNSRLTPAPGSPVRLVASLGLVSRLCRTGRDSPQRPPRERTGSLNESRCLRRAGTHTRTRGVALPGARPDRRSRHAASAEALLRGLARLCRPTRAPASDEASGHGDSARRTMGTEVPDGRARRSARHGFYDRTKRAGRCAANFMSPIFYESPFFAMEKWDSQCEFSSPSLPLFAHRFVHRCAALWPVLPAFLLGCEAASRWGIPEASACPFLAIQ